MSDKRIKKNRQSYVEYNSYRYNYYINSISKVQRTLFQSIPLLFHLNINSLPGYVGKHVPSGIKLYQADGKAISAVQRINRKLNLEEVEDPAVLSIDAVYLQEHFKTGARTVWVIYEDDMQESEIGLLDKKSKNIAKWLNKAGLGVEIRVTSEKNIANVYYEAINPGFHIDKRFFLEDFYAESILLAGKTPLWWWLSEGEANEDYNYVLNSEEYIGEFLEFETFNLLRVEDYYSAAIWYLLNIANTPVTTWLDLSLLLYRVDNLETHETYSSKIKLLVQAKYFPDISQNPKGIYASYVNVVIKDVINDRITLIDNLFIQVLSHYYHSRYKVKTDKSIFDYLYEIRACTNLNLVNHDLGVEKYMSSLESMYKLAEHIFVKFQTALSEIEGADLKKIKDLNPMSDRLLHKLSNSSKNIHILSNPEKDYFSQDRVVIKYIDGRESPWVLSFPLSNSIDNESVIKDIKSFDSIVELLVWSYVNQVIGTGTQILADCSIDVISSMDIVNIIKIISENININDLDNSSLNDFASMAAPVKSLFFVDQLSVSKGSNLAQIHQLIIFNNGEFHTHEYIGYDQFIACAYNWFNLIDHSDLEVKPTIKMFAIKPGVAQELKSSMTGLLHELGSYFESNPISNTRTILKTDDRYYVSHIKGNSVSTSSFDDMESLYKYLEQPLSHYTACVFTETFEQDAMLSYLLTQNRKNTMQLFYYIEGKTIRAFIFDENGALFTYKQVLTHRQSFINHWMVFLKNMKKKYEHELAIEFNQLIKLDDITYEHVPLTGDKLPSDSNYYTLDLKVTNQDNNFKIAFTCEDRVFSSDEQGANLYKEISRYITQKLEVSKNMPVYISDIDVPDELLGGADNRDTYLIDYLKYKRNVEKRLIDKINYLS